MQLIDLHVHSTASDGTLTPTEVTKLALQCGLTAYALTDHDTVDGVAEAMQAAENTSLTVIPGAEFSSPYEGKEIHILGLYLNPHCPELLSALRQVREIRNRRNEELLALFQADGFPIKYEDLIHGNEHTVITRAHFANVLLEKKLIKDRKEAFSKYLSPGCPGYVERQFLTPKGCIEAIKNAGGAAVLAHPTLYDLDMTQVETLCKELISFALDGIECRYSTYTPAQTKAVEKIASTLGLFPSGGSDFHGENKPDIRLGKGMGNLQIPYTYWEDLRTRCR